MDELKSYILEDYDFSEFPRRALVLDVGCGDGRQLQELERRGCLPIGIEPDFSRISGYRNKTLRLIQASGEQIPLKSASCDGLICKVVAPYTNEACVFREIGRVLKQGAVAHFCYHGAGYYLRYLVCGLSWKYRLYGMRTLVNTWLYATIGRRLPSFLGDTIYQSHARLRTYYKEYGLRLLEDRPAPTFLGCSVFIYHAVQKTPDLGNV